MEALTVMFNDLEAHRLEVQLAPSRRRDRRDTDMIRVVVDHGPRWYRTLCSKHPSSRGVRRGKFDTRVRHKNILRTLELMIAGQAAGKYAPELRRIAAGGEMSTGNVHALDSFIITAARQGLITIPWYCQPPFTDEKRRILRRFNDQDAGSHRRYLARKEAASVK